MQKEGEGNRKWPIIHENGKLVIETICCPLASNIYGKKMTIKMATNLSNEIYDNMGANQKERFRCIHRGNFLWLQKLLSF
jgi:hypothetical protein